MNKTNKVQSIHPSSIDKNVKIINGM